MSLKKKALVGAIGVILFTAFIRHFGWVQWFILCILAAIVAAYKCVVNIKRGHYVIVRMDNEQFAKYTTGWHFVVPWQAQPFSIKYTKHKWKTQFRDTEKLRSKLKGVSAKGCELDIVYEVNWEWPFEGHPEKWEDLREECNNEHFTMIMDTDMRDIITRKLKGIGEWQLKTDYAIKPEAFSDGFVRVTACTWRVMRVRDKAEAHGIDIEFIKYLETECPNLKIQYTL